MAFLAPPSCSLALAHPIRGCDYLWRWRSKVVILVEVWVKVGTLLRGLGAGTPFSLLS